MDVARFEELAQAWGGSLSLWPGAERAAAEVFAAEHPEAARAILAEAGALDTLLDVLPEPVVSEGLRMRIAASRTAQPRRQPRAPTLRPSLRRWVAGASIAAGLAVATVGGMLAGVQLTNPVRADARADALLRAVTAEPDLPVFDDDGDA